MGYKRGNGGAWGVSSNGGRDLWDAGWGGCAYEVQEST